MAQFSGIRYDDIYEICREKVGLHNWLRQRGLLGDFAGICQKCQEGYITVVKDSSYPADGVVWRCMNRRCNRKITIRKGSWFSGTHLGIEKVLKLTYYWVYKCSEGFVQRELGIGSNSTIVDWYNFAREVCACVLELDSEKIGGPGKVVEIDESKFGKRKYNRGR